MCADQSACVTGLALSLCYLKKWIWPQRLKLHGGETNSGRGMQGIFDVSEIEICKRSDGSDWLLGQGAFGQVRTRCRATQRLDPATLGTGAGRALVTRFLAKNSASAYAKVHSSAVKILRVP